MAPQPSEADIIFNRANVALAKSQRLIASWLPPRSDDEIKTAKTEEEIEREEQEMFTPVPELLGLGAKLPEDGVLKPQNLSSNDVLRKQLLGKDHARSYRNGMQKQGITGIPPAGSKPRPLPAKRKADEESSEEEGGRSSLGKKKHATANDTKEEESDQARPMNQQGHQGAKEDPAKRSKKTGNYLDEVLSQKQEKHKKKRKKKDVPTSE